jgi:excisionase family DNA binding protein
METNIQIIEEMIALLKQERNIANEMLDFKQAIKYLGISKSKLYKMTHLKELPCYKPGGRKLYFKKSDLDAWQQRNRIPSIEEIKEETLDEISKNKNV